jgi:hypothetical protein
MRGERRVLTALLLGMILNWKPQPLPTVAMLALVLLRVRRDWRTPAAIGASLAGWYALPFLFKPWGYLLEIHATYARELPRFVERAWPDFENFFAFLSHTLGAAFTYTQIQLISATAGLTLACGLLVALQLHRAQPQDARLRHGVLLASALGAAFISAFSPLGQNNALILFAPLLLAAFLTFDRATGRARTAWRAALIATWLVMTVAYSDLIPHGWSEAMRHLILKPAWCLALGLGVLLSHARTRPAPVL